MNREGDRDNEEVVKAHFEHTTNAKQYVLMTIAEVEDIVYYNYIHNDIRWHNANDGKRANGKWGKKSKRKTDWKVKVGKSKLLATIFTTKWRNGICKEAIVCTLLYKRTTTTSINTNIYTRKRLKWNKKWRIRHFMSRFGHEWRLPDKNYWTCKSCRENGHHKTCITCNECSLSPVFAVFPKRPTNGKIMDFCCLTI